MTSETIHRRSDGTIDVDFYRARTAHRRRILLRVHARIFARSFRKVAVATWRWLTPPSRPMPDPGVVMLIAGAAVRNRRL